MKKNEKGFGAIEVLIVIIIVGLIAAVVWLVIDRQKDKTEANKVSTSQPETKSEEKVSDTKQETAQQSKVTSDPVKRLEKLYSDYLSDTSSYRGDSGLAKFKSSGYIASSYTTSETMGEPLVCGQESYPNSIAVQLVNKTDTSATLTGTKVYSDGSKSSTSLRLEMTLNGSSEWQLQKTECVRQ